jgi:hypothetical protein
MLYLVVHSLLPLFPSSFLITSTSWTFRIRGHNTFSVLEFLVIARSTVPDAASLLTRREMKIFRVRRR